MATDEVVLATKLFPPRVRPSTVPRHRLLPALRQGLDVPLTLVCAPAGWGKSTLVGDWLRRDGIAAGWVSLDSEDEDPKRFWRYLLLAASASSPGVGHSALSRLDAAGSRVARDVVPTFLNEVAGGVRRVVVVLDDYHLVTHREVHSSVQLLLDRCPDQLHVVVITRADPPLALSRRRVRGELVEVRADQLRFTRSEAAELLNDRLGLDLAAPDVDRLVARTEGWAAGLQLAAMRLRDHDPDDAVAFIDAFTGADSQVVDYLAEEVLDALPARQREFLLLTSVLGRFCARLCREVTGLDDAPELLAGLTRANLFVTPLDAEPRWFRYHHLFAGLLRHELTRDRADLVPQLQLRAARWHARHGDRQEAVEYALQSGQTAEAAALVAGQWQRYFNAGHWATVQRWLAALPEPVVAAEPSLSVGAVWIALDGARLDEAARALEAAEAAAAPGTHLKVLRALLQYKLGDLTAAGRRLDELVCPPDEDSFVRTVARLVGGLVALWSGSEEQADSRLAGAAALAESDGNRLAWIYATGCRALLAIGRGDRTVAVDLLDQADRAVRESLSDAHFVAMFPALARARLSLRDQDWDGARLAAAHALDLARRGAGRTELAAALLLAAHTTRRAVQHCAAVWAASPSDDLRERQDPVAALTEQASAWVSQARAVLSDCPDPGPVIGSWLVAEQRAGERVPAVGPTPVEPLTDRELAVLRLLPGASSQRELAAALFITPNTLKTHLRAVYRKLGVASRPEAVLHARRTGLL